MKEASRVESGIELLEKILKDLHPADNILDQYFKERRYIGSKDRRYISELVWNIIRKRSFLTEKLGKENLSSRLIVALYLKEKDQDLDLLFNGEEYAPLPLNKEEKSLLEKASSNIPSSNEALYECPQWLIDKINSFPLLDALNTTAPLDVRVNFISQTAALNHLKKEGLFFSPAPLSPLGLRSEDRVNLNNSSTFLNGEIEVMDEGSQLLSLLCAVKPHHKIIDYCAGAGGKSLAIAERLNNEGIIYAHDISQERLSKIKKRADRLNITNIKILNTIKDNDYTRFIIDAPCSGSGTWRRSPDNKYRLTKSRLEEIINIQRELLEYGASHTAVNGRLIYMTCSVIEDENSKQIENFLSTHKEFAPVNHKELWEDILDTTYYPFSTTKYLQFLPTTTKTDGFFFCALKKQQ